MGWDGRGRGGMCGCVCVWVCVWVGEGYGVLAGTFRPVQSAQLLKSRGVDGCPLAKT